MHEISTEIEIAATPEQVWSILMDFSAYPHWNPFIRSISGVVKTGERLNIFVQPTGENGMKFHSTIFVAAPNQELRWLGHFLLPGIFDGEHYFQIEEMSQGRVRFIQGEKFSGLLMGFISLNLMAAQSQASSL